MIVFLNPRAGAGSALARWERIAPRMRERFGEITVFPLNSPDTIVAGLAEFARSDDPRIVAAGGDGTANAVIHALLSGPPDLAQRCILGALGLGSSNDFHKPFNKAGSIDGIPARLAFDRATWCDAGRATFSADGWTSVRYFFLNASIGITAEGNCRFNTPGPVLGVLKRLSTPAAISFAAITALLRYKETQVTIAVPDSHTITLPLTNLGILKSPHFSGELHYDVVRNYANGKFAIVSCERMGIGQRVQLFRALLRGTTEGLTGVRSWSTASCSITAERPVPMEFDGETVIASAAQFTVVPHALRVCP